MPVLKLPLVLENRADDPKAALSVPLTFEKSECTPTAVLNPPVVLLNNDLDPMAVLAAPSSKSTLPMLFLNKAESPMATRFEKVVFDFSAPLPIATLPKPDVLASPACKPK